MEVASTFPAAALRPRAAAPPRARALALAAPSQLSELRPCGRPARLFRASLSSGGSARGRHAVARVKAQARALSRGAPPVGPQACLQLPRMRRRPPREMALRAVLHTTPRHKNAVSRGAADDTPGPVGPLMRAQLKVDRPARESSPSGERNAGEADEVQTAGAAAQPSRTAAATADPALATLPFTTVATMWSVLACRYGDAPCVADVHHVPVTTLSFREFEQAAVEISGALQNSCSSPS